MYVHENHIDVSYFGNKVSERIKNDETVLHAICRLLNKKRDLPNFLNIYKDISYMIQDMEQKYKKKLVLDCLVAKLIDT